MAPRAAAVTVRNEPRPTATAMLSFRQVLARIPATSAVATGASSPADAALRARDKVRASRSVRQDAFFFRG